MAHNLKIRLWPTLAACVGATALVVLVWPGVPMRRRAREAERRARHTNASQPGTTGALPAPLPNPRIVVCKSERRLYLYSGRRIVRSYRAALGFSPVGDKAREGDGRTPEGDYYVCTKNPSSRYYLSLGLSYPNVEDARRGLRVGSITRRQYEEIASAIRARQTPPWNTPLGGEIFIHGHGSRTNWTLGCVALEDADMQELYEAIPVRTPATVKP